MNKTHEEIIRFKKAPTPSNVIEFCRELDSSSSYASLTYLGRSLRGKNIPILILGDPKAKIKILYVAAHHASEWICTSLLLRFSAEICAMAYGQKNIYGINPATLLTSRCIIMIPMLNPDGVEIHQNGISDKDPMRVRLLEMNKSDNFRNWKANGRGVDLNHNYNASFDEYKKIEASLGISGGANAKYSGEYPESEPETALLCNLVRYLQITSAITLHTQGEVIYYTSKGRAPRRSEVIARTLSRMTGYSIEEPEGSACFGGMTDWFIQKLEKPCFTIECGIGENPLPLSDAFDIYVKLREALFTFPILF